MRLTRWLPIILTAALAGTACSSAGTAAVGTAPSAGSAASVQGLSTAGSAAATTTSGPVTVDHAFGTTTVDERPERIVTLDTQWTDTMLALGVTPVGYAIDSYMPGGTAPWQDLPATATAIDITNGVPIEQIAALRPDLIVGSYPITDQALYDRLSAIAPTVASLTDRQVDPWQDMATTAGAVLAEPTAATAVIDGVDAQVRAVAAELPGLQGKSFSLAQYLVGTGLVIVADPQDGSSVFFSDLGMTLYQPVVDAGSAAGSARLQVSTERADLLRADLVAFLVNGGDESSLADIPGFADLPGTTAVLDYPTIVGLNTPSPLSVPYSLQQLRPALEKAAA